MYAASKPINWDSIRGVARVALMRGALLGSAPPPIPEATGLRFWHAALSLYGDNAGDPWRCARTKFLRDCRFGRIILCS
jgi:hypothetical protein